MDPLEEIRKLIILDPLGWKLTYNVEHYLTRMEHNNVIVNINRKYTFSGEINYIALYPGDIRLGWWQRIRFWRLVKLLNASWIRSAAKEIAERVIKEREEDIRKELKELDDIISPDLTAEFARLEEADKLERKKMAASPVTNGFFKGAFKRLGSK